ncbi:hypothetical protein ABT160_10245 [Streptomyces sp. NPDC001941]|uniref:hypothetical protein n=1 Tax=Streptomyces sp. NPDC001941 TaxID=3154659 RepID=UPI00332A3615
MSDPEAGQKTGSTTIAVQPRDVAEFGRFLQDCAGDGSAEVPGVAAVIDVLQPLHLNPGDPSVIPRAGDLVERFNRVIVLLADALSYFSQCIGQIGADLEQIAQGYANAEELAEAEAKDLGQLIATSGDFMKSSGGTLASVADLAPDPAAGQSVMRPVKPYGKPPE